MFSKYIFFLVSSFALVTFAEVKYPGTVVPEACGNNELHLQRPSISQVCTAKIVGEPITNNYLTVQVMGGSKAGVYLYIRNKRSNNAAECQNGPAGVVCMRSYSYVGTVDSRGFKIEDRISRVKTAMVFTRSGAINSLKSADLIGSVFESNRMQVAYVTQ